MHSTRIRISLRFALTLSVCVGCATPGPAPEVLLPPAEDLRAQWTSISVYVPEAAQQADVSAPPAGAGAGLGVGVARGAQKTLELTAEGATGTSDPLGAFVGAAVGCAIGLIYTPTSMVAGAVTAPSKEEVEQADAVYRAVFRDAEVRRSFRARFVEAARERAGVTLAPPEAADTRIELVLARVSGNPEIGAWSVDEPFDLSVLACARVKRGRDGAVQYETHFLHVAPMRQRTFTEWADDDGAALRAELDTALTRLAESLVDEIFLLERPVVGGEAE